MTQRASYYRDNGQVCWTINNGDFVTELECCVHDDGVVRWTMSVVYYRVDDYRTARSKPVEMDRAGARLVLEDWGVCQSRAAAMREQDCGEVTF